MSKSKIFKGMIFGILNGLLWIIIFIFTIGTVLSILLGDSIILKVICGILGAISGFYIGFGTIMGDEH